MIKLTVNTEPPPPPRKKEWPEQKNQDSPEVDVDTEMTLVWVPAVPWFADDAMPSLCTDGCTSTLGDRIDVGELPVTLRAATPGGSTTLLVELPLGSTLVTTVLLALLMVLMTMFLPCGWLEETALSVVWALPADGPAEELVWLTVLSLPCQDTFITPAASALLLRVLTAASTLAFCTSRISVSPFTAPPAPLLVKLPCSRDIALGLTLPHTCDCSEGPLTGSWPALFMLSPELLTLSVPLAILSEVEVAAELKDSDSRWITGATEAVGFAVGPEASAGLLLSLACMVLPFFCSCFCVRCLAMLVWRETTDDSHWKKRDGSTWKKDEIHKKMSQFCVVSVNHY